MVKSSNGDNVCHGIAVSNGNDAVLSNASAYCCPSCSDPHVDVEYRETTFSTEHNVRRLIFDCFCHRCSLWTDLHVATYFGDGKPRTWFFTTPRNWKRYQSNT